MISCRNGVEVGKYREIRGYPIIVPIVIYTGNQRWKIPKNFKEKQISNCVFERYKIDLEYNLVDVNKISNQALLERDTMFGYAMLIEKAEGKNELIKNLDIMIQSTKNEKKLEEIANIINFLLDNVLEKNVQEKLLEKIERRVGEGNMSTLYERLLAESRRDIRQGERKGERKGEKKAQKEIARNMVNKNLKDEIILETTGIKKEELEKIKNKLQMVG